MDDHCKKFVSTEQVPCEQALSKLARLKLVHKAPDLIAQVQAKQVLSEQIRNEQTRSDQVLTVQVLSKQVQKELNACNPDHFSQTTIYSFLVFKVLFEKIVKPLYHYGG